MFTGLVEELGEMIKIQHGINSAKLTVKARKVLEQVKLGDSIAVNGVCLTVVWFSPSQFAAEVMDETLGKTNLGNLVTGDKVNLERALSLGDRLGGHMVSGHIDGVGKIVGLKKVDIANVITIEAPQEVTDYIISKGSVAIDGISLTVVDCQNEIFTVSIIPHTAEMTTLGYKKNGDKVNLEADMIGKYVAKFLERKAAGNSKRKESKIDVNFLAENGFL
ncbi:MAG: riboflavin synthase [Clostridia bacterium]|nr:riboflavin synthase [Clostridia bacterium]